MGCRRGSWVCSASSAPSWPRSPDFYCRGTNWRSPRYGRASTGATPFSSGTPKCTSFWSAPTRSAKPPCATGSSCTRSSCRWCSSLSGSSAGASPADADSGRSHHLRVSSRSFVTLGEGAERQAEGAPQRDLDTDGGHAELPQHRRREADRDLVDPGQKDIGQGGHSDEQR